jgi:hypothetical protein
MCIVKPNLAIFSFLIYQENIEIDLSTMKL